MRLRLMGPAVAAVALMLLTGACATPGTVGGAGAPPAAEAPQQSLPTEKGESLPMEPILVKIDRVGRYSFTSDLLPLKEVPNSIGMESRIVDGEAILSNLRVRVTDSEKGDGFVIRADFVVEKFDGSPALRISPPTVQGRADEKVGG